MLFCVVLSLSQDYQKVLDLVQDIILATDLAHHLRIHKDLEKMAKGRHCITQIDSLPLPMRNTEPKPSKLYH